MRALLPDEWSESVRQIPNSEVAEELRPILRALQLIVQRHGDRALALEDVQELARWTITGPSEQNATPLPRFDKGCRLLREMTGSTWSIEHAFAEQANALHRADKIVNVRRQFESIVAELSALELLVRHGAALVPRERGPGDSDWLLRRGTHDISVEVKRKSPIDDALAVLASVFTGLCRLERHPEVRRYQWEWLPLPREDDAITHLSKDERLEAAVGLWFGGAPTLMTNLKALESRPAWDELQCGSQGCRPRSKGTVEPDCIRLSVIPDSRGMCVKLGCDHHSAALLGHAWASALGLEWEFAGVNAHRSGWLYPTISDGELEDTAQVLRGVMNARPKNTRLYFLIWPVPWRWERALSIDPEQLRALLRSVSDRAPGTPIALWPQAQWELARHGLLLNELACEQLQSTTDTLKPHG